MAAKKTSKAKAKTKRKVSVTAPSGDISRTTVSAVILKDLAKVTDQCKDRASVANGQLGQTTKEYVDKGLNTVAWGLVNRIRRQAQRDPLKARITVEDFHDYYTKLNIDDMLAANMFAEEEGHTNGRGKQADLSEREDVITGSGPEEQSAEEFGEPETSAVN